MRHQEAPVRLLVAKQAIGGLRHGARKNQILTVRAVRHKGCFGALLCLLEAELLRPYVPGDAQRRDEQGEEARDRDDEEEVHR